MITAISLGGQSLISSQIALESLNNGSFPATVYTRGKRGGQNGNKIITPTFASYQLVLDFKIIGNSFSDLALQRDVFFQILGKVHSSGVQTLLATRSDGTSRQIDIKAIEVTGDLKADDGISSNIQVTLSAEYPFLQGSTLKSQDVLINNGGGFAVPFAVPFSMAAGTVTVVSVANNGNYQAYPTFTFIGPLTNPTITDNLTGKTLSIAQTLADSAHSVVVDVYQRTVLLQPSANNGRQYATGDFWTIPIGTSTVTLGNANGTDTGRCTISWRDTWLNV